MPPIDAPFEISTFVNNFTSDGAIVNNIGSMDHPGMDGDEYVRCRQCSFGGCDIRVSPCGCTVHAVSEAVEVSNQSRVCWPLQHQRSCSWNNLNVLLLVLAPVHIFARECNCDSDVFP
jgi:hypothetical protein